MPSQDKDDETGRGQISAEDRAEIRSRADDLERRLKDARGEPVGTTGGQRGSSGASGSSGKQGMARALRMSTEFIAGVIVGAGLGWLIDTAFARWFGTETWPAFFIIFFLLGSAAGMMNVVRAGMEMKTGPSDPSKGPSVPDEED